MRMRNALATSVALTAIGVAPAAVAAPHAPAPAAAPALGGALPAAGPGTGALPVAASGARALSLVPSGARALPLVPPRARALSAPARFRDVGTGGGAKPAPALPSRIRPECGDGKSAEFPIGARIRGGPAVYRSGGGPQTWYLDLTNTSAHECRAVHPVVVFADQDHALKPGQVRMDFLDGKGAGRPVSLEESDQDEVIAVFDGGAGEPFPGFTLAPGGTLTVTVRLAFAPGTAPGEVVADAALVQRKGGDGDWVGESGRYRFSVEGPEEPAEPGAAGSLAHTGSGHADGGALTTARSAALGAAASVFVGAGGALLLLARRLRRS
ncbi:hypothetical protein [Streptomyces sp. NPDC089919]|uniref:hypothetical protein n=1 Tax=Streptomyces sp. NPDC089919 TaxID=3155188 RepID=UPI00342C9489